MKKITFFILLSLLSACFVKKKQVVVKESIPVQVVKEISDTSITRILFSENELDTSILSISCQYFTNNNSMVNDSVNQFISRFIYLCTNLDTLEPTRLKIDKKFVANCLDTFVSQANLINGESEFKTLWSLDITSTINDEFTSFVTANVGNYSFTGGAHGFYCNFTQQFDRISGRKLELKDFISDLDKFNEIAEQCFRKENEFSSEEDLEDLGFWFEENRFQCNDNFSIDENGFHFMFNLYEIAPYVMGAYEFSVPLTLIKSLQKIDLSKKK